MQWPICQIAMLSITSTLYTASIWKQPCKRSKTWHSVVVPLSLRWMLQFGIIRELTKINECYVWKQWMQPIRL